MKRHFTQTRVAFAAIILLLATSFGFGTGMIPTALAGLSTFIPGDVNDDGVFDILDSTVLRRDLAGLGAGISQMCIAELPATGQVTCRDFSGTIIPCVGTGHDGELQAGAALAYQDNGDGTITDLNTGLMWEKLSDDGSIHDWNDTYLWDDAFAVKVATLNTTAFAGHTDWRMPNVRELSSIVDYEVSSPKISPVFDNGCTPACTVLTCSCTASSSHWSSSSLVIHTNGAWTVNFFSGGVNGDARFNSRFVRAVRGP